MRIVWKTISFVSFSCPSSRVRRDYSSIYLAYSIPLSTNTEGSLGYKYQYVTVLTFAFIVVCDVFRPCSPGVPALLSWPQVSTIAFRAMKRSSRPQVSGHWGRVCLFRSVSTSFCSFLLVLTSFFQFLLDSMYQFLPVSTSFCQCLTSFCEFLPFFFVSFYRLLPVLLSVSASFCQCLPVSIIAVSASLY